MFAPFALWDVYVMEYRRDRVGDGITARGVVIGRVRVAGRDVILDL